MDGMGIASLVVDIGLLLHVMMQVFFVEGVFYICSDFQINDQVPTPSSNKHVPCNNVRRRVLQPTKNNRFYHAKRVTASPPCKSKNGHQVFIDWRLRSFTTSMFSFAERGWSSSKWKHLLPKWWLTPLPRYTFCLLRLECSGRVYQLTPFLTDVSDACVFLSNESPKLHTFHYTVYSIGILKMVYYNPHIIWGRISSRINPKPQGFLIAQLTPSFGRLMLGDDLVCKFPHPGCCLVTTKIMINSFSSLTGWGSISQSCFQELELLWKKCFFAISKALHWVKIVSIYIINTCVGASLYISYSTSI